MFSCCKHVCMPESSILNVWDIIYIFLKIHNLLIVARLFGKHLIQFQCQIFSAAGSCNKGY